MTVSDADGRQIAHITSPGAEWHVVDCKAPVDEPLRSVVLAASIVWDDTKPRGDQGALGALRMAVSTGQGKQTTRRIRRRSVTKEIYHAHSIFIQRIEASLRHHSCGLRVACGVVQ